MSIFIRLFSAQSIDPVCKGVLLNGISKFLSDPDRVVCEGAISLDELTASLKSMNTNKAPWLRRLFRRVL